MLTLGEVAIKLRRQGETPNVAADRIKNWAKEGVIKARVKNPGTGRQREFSEIEVRKAEVLEVMARLGMRVMGNAPNAFVTRVLEHPKLERALKDVLEAFEESGRRDV